MAALIQREKIGARGDLKPKNRGEMNLEAHEIASGQSTLHNWETNYGSYDRTYYFSKRITIIVRDLSRSGSGIGIHVFFFIARPADKQTPLFIYNRQDFTISMNGLMESVGEVGAPDLKSDVQHYEALGEHYASGAVHVGWIVVGDMGGRVFQTRAANEQLLQIALGNPRQHQSLQGLIAACNPR